MSIKTLQLAPTAITFGKITQNTLFKVTQGHWFWYQLQACMWIILPVHPTSHRFPVIPIPENWSTSHCWQEVALFSALICDKPQNQRLWNLASRSLYHVVWKLDILNRLGVDHECDRQTDNRQNGLLQQCGVTSR